MLTNNYIESWYNQLKTHFLGCSCNKRFDRLIFILTNEVEFYFKEESIRINMCSGPMTAAQRQQRKIEMSAEAVPAYMHANMIVSPSKAMSLNATLDDTDDILEDRFWFINSFTKDGITYQVEFVNDNTMSIDGTRESTERRYATEAFEYAKNCSLTTRHNEQDLYQLMQYATEEEAEVIRAAYAAPIKAFQEIKAKYEAHFRTLNTQRH
ncbi:hypothetical protein PHYBLDRAFT_145003 [Phycomyces blakesleeanus NRRL 1555(-)]|uniref:Uncharacterized protein n=1 Tax=Phycomyces blakesleeanus (strain ATCC 8743b / DSM 1359 / FGSC 10004 / NBRC 33097 / NRRL 1555) TaxID=763407 RepID=A0A162PVV3_PHYB8|nr:hypothetical protein PHYBLDRAFT_145003 [Phycomyces blakesleeanus NRRL 1555(-)]OAD74566.1 hypothetical protein PHYBLDRAFT_145003 [Phycomyces blakesleeanus NRRL 1555(-)]|eukprot:XP_018292606.1 hypothetical protein PHYBLDRAFT_145003 [Phycomyces blakesleeanus NRRL 1555(-)]